MVVSGLLFDKTCYRLSDYTVHSHNSFKGDAIYWGWSVNNTEIFGGLLFFSREGEELIFKQI